MVGPVKVKFKRGSFEKIRRLPEVKAHLKKHADSIAAEAGDGYVVAEGEGKTRSRAAVIAAHPHARNSNAKHNTLNRILASRRTGI